MVKAKSKSASQQKDWRDEMLGRLRTLVKEADPEVVEEWKWGGIPVWSHDGIICTGETYKSVVKMTFAKGASLKDPSGLFNSSLEGKRTPRHRLPRGREDRRDGVEGAHSCRRGTEQVQGEERSPAGTARDGKQASDDDRRIYPGCPTRGPAAFAPAVRDPQERRAGGRGGDQVGNPLLRGAPIPVRFLRAQGTLQLRAQHRRRWKHFARN